MVSLRPGILSQPEVSDDCFLEGLYRMVYRNIYSFLLILSQVGDTPPTQGRPHRRNREKKNHASPQLLFGLMCVTVVKIGRL